VLVNVGSIDTLYVVTRCAVSGSRTCC